MKNMKKKYDLSKVIKREHEGKWIALSPAYDKIVGCSNDLVSLAREIGKQEVVYMKPTASDILYAF